MQSDSSLERFNRELDAKNFQGQWEAIEQEGGGPELEPHVWKWTDIYETLQQSREVVSLDEQPQGARRSIGLRNPAFSSGNHSSWTINVGMQLVEPDEIARAHRHNITAFRFVINGQPEAYTNVEGERFPMHDGDLILTPQMSWHDHVNRSDEPVIWLDGLDVPFIKALHTPQFENFRSDRQSIDKPNGYSRKKYGMLHPESDRDPTSHVNSTPFRYPWDEVYEVLTTDSETGRHYDPYNGTRLEYVNPVTGTGPTLQTLSLCIQLCPTDGRTDEHRHNSTEIYHVVKGSGRTEVGENTLEWGEGDCFIVPPGSWHSHEATSNESILFSISDKPIFDAFDLHREKTDAQTTAASSSGAQQEQTA